MVGKLVRGALYVHRDAVGSLTAIQAERLERALKAAGDGLWNVARIEPGVVALLQYEDLEASAFPALLHATRVELADGRTPRRAFSRSANPLLLHRKELLVGEEHEKRAAWTATTADLDSRGLFNDSHLIGRRREWLARLAGVGLAVRGDEVLAR